MLNDVASHPALEGFEVKEELSPDVGNPVLLAKSRGGNLVAIRVLATRSLEPDVLTMLSREASLSARLGHEAIVQPRAMITRDDFAAVVTEFVPGVSLQRLLRFAAARGVRLPDVVALYVLERVLAALVYAHSQKDASGSSSLIVHGRIAASSVVVGWDGRVKLGDFGLARMWKLLGQTDDEDSLVVPMSPERARGGRATDRSDVFGVALLAIRLLTGRTPYARFGASAAKRMLAMAEADVTRLAKTRPDLPAALRDALDASLEADPEKRPHGARALHEVLRAHVDQAAGKEAVTKLLGRWRAQLESSVAPWERRASMAPSGEVPAPVPAEAATLALTLADERPSSDALVATDPDSEPWMKKDSVPKEETALLATDPAESASRIGSVAEDAFSMPLPPMRMTMPSYAEQGLPVYGGPPVNVPRPSAQPVSGRLAAFTVVFVFAVLVFGTVVLFRWLLGPM